MRSHFSAATFLSSSIARYFYPDFNGRQIAVLRAICQRKVRHFTLYTTVVTAVRSQFYPLFKNLDENRIM
jgi:hypothetical protein